MSTDIDSIKRKLLIKYPTFGSVIANLEFQASNDIETAGTDGKVVLYSPKFLGALSEKQQIFIFAHEICHVAFEHIFRSEGKDKRLWNIATDSVINALLKQDGLPMVEGGVDIPEAIHYDAEEMYNKLLEEKKKQEQQNSQGNQRQQNSQNSQEQQDSQGSQGQQNSQDSQVGQNSQSVQEEADIGHDTHSLWDKAIEERKQEQQEQLEKNAQEQRKTKERKNRRRKTRRKREKRRQRRI